MVRGWPASARRAVSPYAAARVEEFAGEEFAVGVGLRESGNGEIRGSGTSGGGRTQQIAVTWAA